MPLLCSCEGTTDAYRINLTIGNYISLMPQDFFTCLYPGSQAASEVGLQMRFEGPKLERGIPCLLKSWGNLLVHTGDEAG